MSLTVFDIEGFCRKGYFERSCNGSWKLLSVETCAWSQKIRKVLFYMCTFNIYIV